MTRLSDFCLFVLFLLLFGFVGWVALCVGVACWWWAVEIFARDAIFISYPLLSDSLKTSYQYALVGIVFTLLGLDILLATWNLAKDEEIAPEYYMFLLNGLTWVFKKVIPFSLVGVFFGILGAYFLGFDMPIVELKPGAAVFVLLIAAISFLNWDINQDQKAAEGKYALAGQSLMSGSGTRLFVLSVITFLTFFGLAAAEPRDLLYLREIPKLSGLCGTCKMHSHRGLRQMEGCPRIKLNCCR